jgi:hypothetical protein
VLSGLAAALALAAFVAGLTGTWSPCGFSMIETIGPTGHSGGRRTTLAASATFALGALAGGALTFVVLSGAGALLHSGPGPRATQVVAALVALAAAAGELRGVRIVPQVRRQVPEHWRRVVALPVAAGLYGILLGLGFTTFVLTLAVWALFGIALALGDPGLGLAVGLAFGLGRLLPVVALAPFAGTPRGQRACATMAERPAILRGFRLADATALLVCALVLAAGPASAASRTVVSSAASDPSAAGGAVAYERPDGTGVVLRAGAETPLPGHDPALGGGLVAWLAADQVTIASATTLAPATAFAAPGADAVAVSSAWIVWRARQPGGGDLLLAARVADPARVARVAVTRAPTQIGQPSLDGGTLVFAIAGRGSSRIVAVDLDAGKPRTLRRGHLGVMVSNPSLRAGRLLYVRTSSRTQELRLGPAPGGRERVLYRIAATARRDRGYDHGKHPLRHHYRPKHPPPRQKGATTTTLWTTALTDVEAYVTRLRIRRGKTSASVLRVAR